MHRPKHVMAGAHGTAHKEFANVPSATGGITRLAFARAKEAGLPLGRLLSDAGLTLGQIEDRHARLKVTSQITFLELVADALRDDLLGFRLAHDFELREIGLLYYVMASSDMLEDALRRAERYSGIVNEGISVQLRPGTDTAITLRYVGVKRHLDLHQLEFWLTTIVRVCRQLTGRRLVPIRVKVLHRRMTKKAKLKAFFGCDIECSAGVDEIVFLKSDVRLPITSADPYLNEMLIEYCENALSHRKVRAGSLRPDVDNAIALLLPHGKAHADEISRKLGMSRRTLARRLSSEGLSFSRVLDELKVDLAKRYLQDEDLPISEIAWLLGYREVSALTHAVKRWFGKAPREMRFNREFLFNKGLAKRTGREIRSPARM